MLSILTLRKFEPNGVKYSDIKDQSISTKENIVQKLNREKM